MPRLWRYVDHPGYYVKTSFSGRPVTFQLTDEGATYLLGSKGLSNGSSFDRWILFGLYNKGWAFTGGSGTEVKLNEPETWGLDTNDSEDLSLLSTEEFSNSESSPVIEERV